VESPYARGVLVGLLILLACQLVGEFAVRVLDVTLPGPVVGLVLFFGWLCARRPAPDAPEVTVSEGLLKHLQLLFIPAGVGVVEYLSTLGDTWLPIVGALLGSWLLALVVTALVSSLTMRLVRR